jgi:Na+-driven multidrug efflux pump
MDSSKLRGHPLLSVQILVCLIILSWSEHVCCFAVGDSPRASYYRSKLHIRNGVVERYPRLPTTTSLASISADVSYEDDDEGEEDYRGGAQPPPPGIWPSFDALDKRLIKIALPVIANFAINPLIGAVDLFWVNRMGNALAVAGQSAANQIFNSAFWITSFLPSVTATLIAKEMARGNEEGVQDSVCQALFVGVLMALASSIMVFSKPNQILSSVLLEGAPALEYARPYLLIRAFAFVPSLISLVGFSAFRGVLDTVTPVKVSLFANVFNAVLDPILIFGAGMGVTGAALATLTAELVSAVTYLVLLRKRNMISFQKLFRFPAWAKLEPLIRGGAALQLRNVALNITFLAVARVVQGIDQSGVAAAAHAMAIQGMSRMNEGQERCSLLGIDCDLTLCVSIHQSSNWVVLFYWHSL